MKSKVVSKRLGVMVLLLTMAGPAGPFAAGDPAAPPPDTVTRAQFEVWFKEISNWGRWGKDDELGTLNLITPEKRRAAAALVRDGVSVSLALDLNKRADAINTNRSSRRSRCVSSAGTPWRRIATRSGTMGLHTRTWMA